MPAYPQTKVKTIPYKSPSGQINISKWIPPFQKVHNGFGFVGVLAEDTGTGKLQCHICGQWFEMLTTHIFAKHDLNSAEYANEFGLARQTALKSMRIRKIQSKVMLGMRLKHKKHRGGFKKNNKESANRKGTKKPAEIANRFGICDLQVKDKILKLKKKLGKTPALTQLIDEYGQGLATLIHTRYSGYLRLLKTLNLQPVTSSFTPKYSKDYFLQLGLKVLAQGKPLIAKRVLNQSENRNIYNYYKSQTQWKRIVIKNYNKNLDNRIKHLLDKQT